MGYVQISRLISASSDDIYAHITNLENLPTWVGAHVGIRLPESRPESLRVGSEFVVGIERFGIEVPTRIRVDEMQPTRRFSYRVVEGLFASFLHTQTLEPQSPESVLLTDEIRFSVGLGLIGTLIDDLYMRHEIENVLRYRSSRIEECLRK